MGIRFHRSFKLFPGVRLNVSKSGLSASVGVPGATVNVSQRGIRTTTGIPGTGISHQSSIRRWDESDGASFWQPTPQASSERGDGGNAYTDAPEMREIASASVEGLTSASLATVKEMILQASAQEGEVANAQETVRRSLELKTSELNRRKRSLLRFFNRKKINALEEQIFDLTAEREELDRWAASTKIKLELQADREVQSAYEGVLRAFDQLRGSKAIWDIMRDRSTDRVAERTIATRTIDRIQVQFSYDDIDLFDFEGRAMHFENANGEDIYLLPGLAFLRRGDGVFALLDANEIKIDASLVNFVEADSVPSDSKVVGRTWEKTNKDGSPDRRFSDNFEIPICEYGRLIFESRTGLCEEYQASDARATVAFGEAFEHYRQSLPRSPHINPL